MLVMSVLCYVMMAISYWKPEYNARITWCCTVYFSLRLTSWLILAEIKGNTEGGDYVIYVAELSYNIFFSYILLFNSFEPTFSMNCVAYTTAIFGTTFVIRGLKIEEDDYAQLKTLMIGFPCIIYILR
jgi:hypothetical protein